MLKLFTFLQANSSNFLSEPNLQNTDVKILNCQFWSDDGRKFYNLKPLTKSNNDYYSATDDIKNLYLFNICETFQPKN